MHLFRTFPAIMMVLLLFAACLCAQQNALITVDTRHSPGPVNRLIFGNNINAADNARIFSSDTTDPNLIQRGDGFWNPDTGAPVPAVLQFSKAIGMSMLRYPGGCLVHNYDWRKTVGPDAKASGWKFGLDEYLSLCRSIGAVPLITISDYVLPADQMPANAASLVEYLNAPADAGHPWAMKRKQFGHPDPYHVVYFELGNESMHGNHRVIPFRRYTAEQYATYANATAAAMRKVDPTIKIGILTVPGTGADPNVDWNTTVVRLAGATADFIIVHFYVPQQPKVGISEDLLMQSMMVAPQHIEQRLSGYHRMIRQQLGHDLPLAITEYNGRVGDDAKPYRFSFANALECADLVRVFLRPESNVLFANYYDFANGYFGMIQSKESAPDGQPINNEPAYFTYAMWGEHFGTRLAGVTVDGPRADFAGAGSEEPDQGSTVEPKRLLQTFDLDKASSTVGSLWPRLLNTQIQRNSSGNLSIRMQGLGRSIFPTLAHLERPAGTEGAPVQFNVSFDAQFTPDPGSDVCPLGIGLIDSRGWDATHSGIGLDDIGTAWKHLEGTYNLDAQTTAADLSARLMANSKNVSGTLQIKNLQVTAYNMGHDSAYPLLTAAASTSADGQHAFLIVFNKSASDAISADVRLPGFPSSGAHFWEVNDTSLATIGGAKITQNGTAFSLITPTSGAHTFPAHSMTAIEFTAGSQ